MRHVRPAGIAGAALAIAAIVVGACAPTASSAPAPSRSAPAAVPASPGASPGFDAMDVRVKTDIVATGLTDPVDVTPAWDGSGRLFVVERPGRIRIVKDGTLLHDPFIDIHERITSGGERGLLGLAFHPDYPADPRFFVDYTDLNGDTVVSEFRAGGTDPDHANRDSERVLVRIQQPYANHNGGGLAFGPDGMLYISTGDGGSSGDPQGHGRDLGTLLAKILRIDVDGDHGTAPYVIPSDNPFVGRSGARPEVWLTGLRNPWRMRFDRKTGDLWIGDAGQDAWEEIDVARAGVGGLDFGWNTMEGDHCFQPASGCDQTGLTLPVAEYGHDVGCAVIGGAVVRDPDQPKLDGGYVFGDTCTGTIWMLDPVGDGRDRSPASVVATIEPSLSAINEGEDGMIYATVVESGHLLRISAAN
jgi:Glucose/sorbosone dehydrogenases